MSVPWRPAIAAWGAAIALLAALAALRWMDGGAALPGGAAAAGREGPALVFAAGTLPVERVERLVVRREGTTHEFARGADGWRQTKPFEQPADGAQLRDVLLRAADLRATRSLPAESVDRAALGLEPAAAEVEVQWPGGSHRLHFGRRGVGGRAWLRVDDGPALAVDASLHESILDADPRRWRSWRLFDAVGTGTDRVVVVRSPIEEGRPAQRLELERRDGRWRLTAPVSTRADAAAVEALLGAMARVEHAGFVDDAPGEAALYGLERPIATIEASGADGAAARRTETIEIGAGQVKGGALCARRTDRPPIVLLDPPAIAALLPTPASLVDGRPCGIPPSEVRALRVLEPDGAPRFDLVRTLDGWRLDEPGGASSPARESAVTALLERLGATRAQELAIQSMPAELQVASIVVTPSNGAPVTVRLAREGPQGRWALDESDEVLRVFPPSFDPPLDPRAFRAR